MLYIVIPYMSSSTKLYQLVSINLRTSRTYGNFSVDTTYIAAVSFFYLIGDIFFLLKKLQITCNI